MPDSPVPQRIDCQIAVRIDLASRLHTKSCASAPTNRGGGGTPASGAAYESQALPVGSVQRPDVPPSPTMHRAGVMHDGPSTVSQDAPSIASSLQVPVWLPLATPVEA